MNAGDNAAEVEGKVAGSRRVRASWAWLFPLLALGATAWLLWNDWRAQGPEIQIRFAEAPGVQPGKTALMFRGVQAGRVTRVHLDEGLGNAVVSVRLKGFAAGLARDGTDFWIEQPVISLREISGIEAIVEGNSIQARLGHGTSPRTVFEGLRSAPLLRYEGPGLVVHLRAASMPFLGRGTPVFRKGVRVGWVRAKSIDERGTPTAVVAIEEEHASAVRANSRFWVLPATSLSASPGQLSLNIPGIEALLYGGIAFDEFGTPGPPAEQGAVFDLESDEMSARACGPPIEVDFDDGWGLVAGQTRVCYLGRPIGVVARVSIQPAERRVTATLRLEPDFARLATTGSTFLLVRPAIGPQGIVGLETLVSGPYIAFEPGGPGELPSRFVGRSTGPAPDAPDEPGSLVIELHAGALPDLGPGVPIYHRGQLAGRVRSVRPDGPALGVSIAARFRDAVRENSRFWRVPAASVAAGPGLIDVSFEGLAALWQGGIAFDNFGPGDAPAAPGASFELFAHRRLAQAVSPPVRIRLENAQGLLAGHTELRYLGLPVGIVTDVAPREGLAEATARFFDGYDFLRKSGGQFAVVRPELSLQGVSGLEALVSGIYIACIPGAGPGFQEEFRVVSTPVAEVMAEPGFDIRLISKSTKVGVGAPVNYNDTRVGEIVEKSLSADGRQVVLTARIQPAYRRLVRKSSVFWDATVVAAKIAFLKVDLQAPSLLDPAGRVDFHTPDLKGPAAQAGARFDLLPEKPRRLRW